MSQICYQYLERSGFVAVNASTVIAASFAVGFYAVIISALRRTQRITARSPLVVLRSGNPEEIIAGVVMFVFPLLLIASTMLQHLRLFRPYFDGPALRAAAAVVLLSGLALQAVSMATLGPAMRIGIDRERPGPLVRHGPYRYIRHPIYTALLGYYLGAWLLQPNPLFSIILLVAVPRIVYQAFKEERALVQMFGEDYAAYMKSTKRFIPGVA